MGYSFRLTAPSHRQDRQCEEPYNTELQRRHPEHQKQTDLLSRSSSSCLSSSDMECFDTLTSMSGSCSWSPSPCDSWGASALRLRSALWNMSSSPPGFGSESCFGNAGTPSESVGKERVCDWELKVYLSFEYIFMGCFVLMWEMRCVCGQTNERMNE